MSEEVINERRKYELHEGIVFAIELTATMLQVHRNTNKSNLQVILEALQEAMAHSVITLPNTGYGCFLFNSQETSKGRRKGVQEIFSLKDLNYKDMKSVYEILEENTKVPYSDRPYIPLDQRFHPLINTEGIIPLHEALLTLQHEVTTKKDHQKQYNIKKIFLFTDNDTPVDPDDKKSKELTRNVCSDIDNSFVTISPFFLNSEGKPFDNSLYSEIMRLVESEDQEEAEEGEDGLIFDGPSTRPINVEDIRERITRRKEIKRIQFQCPLVFSDKLTVGIKGYAVYTHETSAKTKLIYETADFRKNVYSKTRYTNAETSADIEKVTRLYNVGAGGDNIVFDPEQEAQIQKYDDKHDTFLRIIGFKDEKSGVKTHYNSARSPFVIPDEDTYSGSTRTMSALYQSLKKTGKVAIVFGKIRKSGQPSFYALQATRKKPSPESRVSFPEGFFLIRLPYFDDIRQFPKGYELMSKQPEESFSTKTRQMLRELKKRTKEYLPQDYKNPGVQLHYRVLHDYLLQVEQTTNDMSLEEKRIQDDDTIKKTNEVRGWVLDKYGNDTLAKHMKEWNGIFNGM